MNHELPTPGAWEEPEVPEVGRHWRVFRARWWSDRLARLLQFLGRMWAEDADMPGAEPLVMPSLLDVHEPSDTFIIETPAMGDAFSFFVRVRCSWCVQATAAEDERERKIEEVREFIAASRPITRLRIEETIRPIARGFPPYRAAEAEELLNREITDCLNDGDVQVKVRAWVDVSDPVREELKKVWLERLHSDAEGDSKKANVDLLTELQDAWQKLLVKGLEGIGAVPEVKAGWLAPYALALAEDPKNAADTLRKALEARVRQAEKLLADLGNLAAEDHIEEIEFAFQSDSTLRAVLAYLGVPVPSRNGATSGAGGVSNA